MQYKCKGWKREVWWTEAIEQSVTFIRKLFIQCPNESFKYYHSLRVLCYQSKCFDRNHSQIIALWCLLFLFMIAAFSEIIATTQRARIQDHKHVQSSNIHGIKNHGPRVFWKEYTIRKTGYQFTIPWHNYSPQQE